MRVQDLRPGWRTDFILHRARADTEVRELEGCIAVRTHANPDWYWGNCLVLEDDPADGDLAHWLARFEREVVAGRAGMGHVAIGINTPHLEQDLPSWRAAGLTCHVNAVMRCRGGERRPPAQPPRGEVVVRPIDFGHEVAAVIELELADTHGHAEADYRRYREQQFALMRPLHEAGQLEWFGLWCNGVLAADCGLMREHSGQGATARFQRVATHPAWRRRGLCTALVDAVARYGFERWQVAEQIMVADPADVAIGIYRRLGFSEFEREWLFERWPRARAHGAPGAPGRESGAAA